MKYKYEIAFSFLAKDEALAYELNDLISDRVTTFIYSKRQEELGGTDGELSFNKVFSEEARIVVVLFRNGWGETPWTRIEETAIRNRAYNEGFGFVIYVLLDRNSTVPKYLPKAQLWVDYKRWGLKGIAPILEQRIKEGGGEIKEETVQARMDRFKRLKLAEQKRTEYLRSSSAMDDSINEFLSLINELKNIKPSLESTESDLLFATEELPERFYELGIHGFYLLFKFEPLFHAQNGVCSKLSIFIYQKEGRRQGLDYKETVYLNSEYVFDQSLIKSLGWKDNKDNFLTSNQLIDYWIKKYIDELEQLKIKKQKNRTFWAF